MAEGDSILSTGQFDPVSIAAISSVGSSLIGAAAKLFGASSAQDAIKAEAKKQAQALKAQLAQQQAGLSAAAQQQQLLERQHADQLAYEAAMSQRSQQVVALYAVGGVALLVGGYFIVKAMNKPGTKVKRNRR